MSGTFARPGTAIGAGLLSACLGTTALAADFPTALMQQDNAWFTQGQDTVAARAEVEPIPGPAKNVVVLIADGMGPATVTATRIFEGQQRGEAGEENVLSFEEFPNTALIKTYNTNSQTPDSAGTAVAWLSGVKTKQGVLGVDEDVLRGVCSSTKGNEVMSLLEMAETVGMSTGTVTTARLTHATPAAGYAHTPDRNWENDSDLTEEAVQNGCADVASQLLSFPYGDGIDVALGGGRREFIPETMEDPEDAPRTGQRTDGRDLTAEWLELHGDGAAYVWNSDEFEAVDPTRTTKLLGLFDRSHMEYEHDRPKDVGGEPSLSEMTAKALEILQQNENGFVLQVESGRVDHAHHATNAYRALTDAVEFHETVATVMAMVDPQETLVIVSADHSHAFTLAGYTAKGSPILGPVLGKDDQGRPTGEPVLAEDGMPYTIVSYLNGVNAVSGRERTNPAEVDTTDPNYVQDAIVPLASESHSAVDVAAYAHGPMAHLVGGVMEQNVIFHVMNEALGLTDRVETAMEEGSAMIRAEAE